MSHPFNPKSVFAKHRKFSSSSCSALPLPHASSALALSQCATNGAKTLKFSRRPSLPDLSRYYLEMPEFGVEDEKWNSFSLQKKIQLKNLANSIKFVEKKIEEKDGRELACLPEVEKIEEYRCEIAYSVED
eukprot:759486-Hanusia_phi.AAC.2